MLYYPFANAPLPVLHQAVLYWDDLATVVAPGWEGRLTDRMREVNDAGLYRPIGTHDAYEPIEFEAIEAELNHALSSVPLDDLIPPSEPPSGDLTTLHMGKLHQSVVNELTSRGLAYPHPHAPTRLVSSPALIRIVISIIATRIAFDNNVQTGCLGPLGLRPHTDLENAYRLATEPTAGHDVTSCWRVELGPLLPVPRDDVMISDLLSFRNMYNDERLQLMDAIDALLHQLQRENRHPTDAFRIVERRLATATAALHAAARGSKFGWKIRSLAASVAFAGSIVAPHLAPVPDALLTVADNVAINVATSEVRRSGSSTGDSGDYMYLHRAAQFVNGHL